ncbi:biosynthetic peptidoglycan transglycosylase [Dehalobacter sp. TeCB1]|uniref:biosynthetic peptidoglycan transglycosylase n=1 Tax=Dehalobacter sp. TeCB1 TaxID=1843715 RepID=UPI00083B036B|nr:biosynthetic peptidoglycan transglycosylase [Dehalobacter sp. TeCB1]OCZ49822.1 glycosyl transferase [Dehalobacter sp. TeCB1]
MRFVKGLLKLLILLFIVLGICWFGLKFYFTHINSVADTVRSEALTSVKKHNSQFITYDEIPETYRNAVIATEDSSFFTNKGIDPDGTLRAVIVDIRSKQPLQGGSSITQQLVHNTILSRTVKSITWKFLEGIYAIGLYDTMSKQEIFVLYANVIYFGHGAYGLYQAAEIYFGKIPSALNAGEQTMLAGIPNAPNDYDPYKNMVLARQRQNIVVQSMVGNGVISGSRAKKILSEPIKLK